MNRPHILLMTCHDLGRHLGCYGVETVDTPHIDALAGEGVRMSRAFTTSPGCSPARAALATGRYPHSNGVMGLAHPPFNWDLRPGERHLAALLSEAGYSTHLFGFQHVSMDINRLGFATYPEKYEIPGCNVKIFGVQVHQQVKAFLHGAPSDRPLYLEVNLEEPHRPYDQGGVVPDVEHGVFVPPYLPPDEASTQEMAALQGAIRQADRAVGEILAVLDDASMAQNTIVIFLADHGLAMPRAKCTLYDAGIEIALLMRWQNGGIEGGRTFAEMLSNIDILPTLLELVGVPVPETVQGRSFVPMLRGEPYVPRVEIHAEKTYHSYYDPMRAVRTERFKYIRNFSSAFRVEVPGDVQDGPIFRAHTELYSGSDHDPVELYDLSADPWEQHNLAGITEFSEVERWLDAKLWGWMTKTNDPLLLGPIPSPAYRYATEDRPVAQTRITSE